MAPTKIMIIRHGEKPPKAGGPPHGVTVAGDRDPNSLDARGWQRAGALVRLFAPRATLLNGLLQPAAIFAAGTSDKPDSHATSRRSQETVQPVADLLGLTPDARFTPKHYEDAAAAILLCAGPVLVAWEHKRIGRLIASIAPEVQPPFWPGDRFDMVLVLDGQPGSYVLTQVPQMLLAGDSSAPLPATGPNQPDQEDDG